MTPGDITQTLISTENIRQQIVSIFPDSVILDLHFNFVSVSQNILDVTGYRQDELKGKSVSLFSYSSDLRKEFEERLSPGFFEDEHFDIRCKETGSILCSVSGFYLGLITEINGIIVLKFRNLDQINLLLDQLEAKTAELDRFVYLSSHALRGPLATLQGLINLAKNSSVGEMGFLLNQMEIFANKLDNKLYRLIYFAEADKTAEVSPSPLQVASVCAALQASISEASVNQPIRFKNLGGTSASPIDNGEAVISLLRNIVLFFCGQPRDRDNSILFDAHSSCGATELILRVRGFQLNDSLAERLQTLNFGYSEILNHAELINFYAAKKIVFLLRGNIQFVRTSGNELVILITLPKNGEGRAKREGSGPPSY